MINRKVDVRLEMKSANDRLSRISGRIIDPSGGWIVLKTTSLASCFAVRGTISTRRSRG